MSLLIAKVQTIKEVPITPLVTLKIPFSGAVYSTSASAVMSTQTSFVSSLNHKASISQMRVILPTPEDPTLL